MLKLFFNTETLYKDIKKEVNISFDLYYAHLEYLRYKGYITYPNTVSEKLSLYNDLDFISNEKFENLKKEKPEYFDLENKNNHNPLLALKLNGVFHKEAIYLEEYNEFNNENYYNRMSKEKLSHLNLIYSKIVERTKLLLNVH